MRVRRLRLEEAQAYANVRYAEAQFDYADSQDTKRKAAEMAHNFLTFLRSYEAQIPKRIRKTLGDFSETKTLAEKTMKIAHLDFIGFPVTLY